MFVCRGFRFWPAILSPEFAMYELIVEVVLLVKKFEILPNLPRRFSSHRARAGGTAKASENICIRKIS